MSHYHSLFDDLFNSAFFVPYGQRLDGANQGQVERRQTGPENPKQVDRPFLPALDLHLNEDTNTMTATFELPGLTKENVNIEVDNNRLFVSGETSSEKEVKEEGFVHRERQTGKFLRTLKLPVGTKVSTDLSNYRYDHFC